MLSIGTFVKSRDLFDLNDRFWWLMDIIKRQQKPIQFEQVFPIFVTSRLWDTSLGLSKKKYQKYASRNRKLLIKFYKNERNSSTWNPLNLWFTSFILIHTRIWLLSVTTTGTVQTTSWRDQVKLTTRERLHGQLTIRLTINDCLTVTTDGSNWTHQWHNIWHES